MARSLTATPWAARRTHSTSPLQAICAELVAQRIDVERVDSIGRLVAGLFGMHEHASICSPFEAEDLADLRDLHKGLYELGARLHHRIRRDLGWPTPGGTLEADEEAEAAYNAERKVVQARLDAAMASIQANLDKAAK